jgi:hypothetical protein
VFCSLIQIAAADLVLSSARELQRTWQPSMAPDARADRVTASP